MLVQVIGGRGDSYGSNKRMHQGETSRQKSANRETNDEPGYEGRKVEAVPLLYIDSEPGEASPAGKQISVAAIMNQGNASTRTTLVQNLQSPSK